MLRKRRLEAGLTQRAVAGMIDVKASYIAYIESNKRKPSLPVLLKLAAIMSIDPLVAFVLAHPEAKTLVGQIEEPERKDAWQLFSRDRLVLQRWVVDPSEMRFLRRLSQLGVVAKPGSYLFFLNSVRQAVALRSEHRRELSQWMRLARMRP
jgi:transcriptional regulator with XRE-family HTH domain